LSTAPLLVGGVDVSAALPDVLLVPVLDAAGWLVDEEQAAAVRQTAVMRRSARVVTAAR
jgi:hypothetical protein